MQSKEETTLKERWVLMVRKLDFGFTQITLLGSPQGGEKQGEKYSLWLGSGISEEGGRKIGDGELEDKILSDPSHSITIPTHGMKNEQKL